MIYQWIPDWFVVDLQLFSLRKLGVQSLLDVACGGGGGCVPWTSSLCPQSAFLF